MTLSIWLGRLALVLAFLGIAVDAEATDGYVDASYAVDGAARVSATNSYGPQAIVVRPGGRLTYASARPDAAYKDVLVGQRNADGSPDTGFAGGGQLRIFTTGAISGPRLAFDPYSRRVVLAATDYQAGVYRLLLCRINDDGTLDSSFTLSNYPGQTGCIRTNPPASAPQGLIVSALSTGENGVVVAAGSALNYAGSPLFRVFIASAQPGTLDVAYRVEALSTFDVTINGMVPDRASGYLYLTGNIKIPDGMGNLDAAILVVKANFVLTWNWNFFQANQVTRGFDEGRAIALKSDGKIVVAGTVDEVAPVNSNCALLQVDSSLNLDTGFGQSNGHVYTNFTGSPSDSTSCSALAVDGADRIYVAGAQTLYGGGDRDMLVARFDTYGHADASFGNAGSGLSYIDPTDTFSTSYSESALAIGLQNGRVILAGPSEPFGALNYANDDLVMVRLRTDDFVFSGSFE